MFFAQCREGFREAYTDCILLGGTPVATPPTKAKNESAEIAFCAIKKEGLNLN
jgi:hypothetical protein